MTAVPRLCEILHDRIHQSINNSGGFAQRLAHMALKLGHARATNTRLPLLQMITYRMLDYTVRRKIQAHFGGRLKLMVSGGAALPPRVGRFFLALGLPLVQGYGQTEASPVISASPPDDIRITSVGPALPGVRVKLSDKGELLVRGDLVMQGYWKRPEDTAKVLQKGWLHTGDLAEMDADGYITIIGRSKDIIVNSGGENISPMRVEERLTSQPNIAQAMVDGDRRPWIAAVVVPSEACIARANGHRDKIISLIQNDIDTANTRLTTVERIRRFVLAEDGFTVENKRLTPTLKIRRHIIRREFRDQIDRLYDRHNL
jgi:long-chain acyl-CoA synthetase